MLAKLMKEGAIDISGSLKLTRANYNLVAKKDANHITLYTHDKTVVSDKHAPFVGLQIMDALGKSYELERLLQILDETCILVNADLITPWIGNGVPVVAKKKDYIGYMVYAGELKPGLCLLKTVPADNTEWKKTLKMTEDIKIDTTNMACNGFAKMLMVVVTSEAITKRPKKFIDILNEKQ